MKMIKHYIAGLLLFVISSLVFRGIAMFVAIAIGFFSSPRFGRDLERDMWELRRYAYLAYPAITSMAEFYHLHDSYQLGPHDGNLEIWSRHPGILHIEPGRFPYYVPFIYQVEGYLQEPVYYSKYARVGPGSLIYCSRKNAWWLYGYDYLHTELDDFPVLINLSKDE